MDYAVYEAQTVLFRHLVANSYVTDLRLTVLFAAPSCVTSTAAALSALTVVDQAVVVRAFITRAVFDCGRSDHISSDKQQNSVIGTL